MKKRRFIDLSISIEPELPSDPPMMIPARENTARHAHLPIPFSFPRDIKPTSVSLRSERQPRYNGPMATARYVHLPLDEEVTAIGGSYRLVKESRLELGGRDAEQAFDRGERLERHRGRGRGTGGRLSGR